MNIILKFNTILPKNIQIDNQVIFFSLVISNHFSKIKINIVYMMLRERERGRGSKSEDFKIIEGKFVCQNYG